MKSESINVCISIDNNYIMQALAMLKSLFMNNLEYKFNVYLIYADLDSKNVKRITDLVKLYGNCIIVKEMQKGIFSKYEKSYPENVYYRVFLPYIFEDIDKILWLDTDIIVNGDIFELYNIDISNFYAGVCEDYEASKTKIDLRRKKLNIEKRIYFNAGVLLLNTKKIRQEIHKEQYLEVMEKYNAFLEYPDQDVLNIVFKNKVLFIKDKYNYQKHMYYNKKKEDIKEIIVIHYIISKPWKYKSIGHLNGLFWKYAKMCGYTKEYNKYFIKSVLFHSARSLFRLMKKFKKI